MPLVQRGVPMGLYAAAVGNKSTLFFFWSELVARPAKSRASRSSHTPEPPPSNLKWGNVYALAEFPLEPLVLMMFVQQSASKEVAVVEACDISPLLTTLWGKPGVAMPIAVIFSPFVAGSHAGNPNPTPNPNPNPYPDPDPGH